MSLDFLYGTAWKEGATSECVMLALKAGFRGIDTANQRKHYNEPGVGDGLLKAYKLLGLKRENLFLQSKFTFARGHDHRKPYDENDPYNKQVRSSFESTLQNLHTDYLDSFILHGPYTGLGLTDEDKETWREMEALQKEGLVKNIGISNISPDQLKTLYEFAKIKPRYAQIRCFAQSKWEKQHRDFCREKDIVFQGFSLLTANWQFLESKMMAQLISETQKHPAQIIFKFCLQVGMLPLTGTTSLENMKMDLNIFDFELTPDQVIAIENIAFV